MTNRHVVMGSLLVLVGGIGLYLLLRDDEPRERRTPEPKSTSTSLGTSPSEQPGPAGSPDERVPTPTHDTTSRAREGADTSARGLQRESARPSDAALELDKRLEQRAIRAFTPVARRCYTDMLKRGDERGARGEFTLDVIASGGRGRVELVRIAGADGALDAGFHECLLEDIGEVEFELPPGEDRSRVTYPFEFHPEVHPDDAGFR